MPKPTEYNTRHGGPFDRGSADAYYHRPTMPHYYSGATYSTQRMTNLTPEQLAAYMAGYNGQTERKEY